jgi:hypothetical protein
MTATLHERETIDGPYISPTDAHHPSVIGIRDGPV